MKFNIIGAVAGTAVVAGAVSVGAAYTLFNKVIPRQDGVKVDLNEMADMAKWEEYKKIISLRGEWLRSQELEEINIKSRDGLTLHSWYLPAENPTGRVAIIEHGYTSKGLDSASHAYFFHNQGFDCILPDHRAHGDSEGEYIGFGILDRFDCISWIKYAVNRFGDDTRILLHGTSMGATTVLMASGLPDFPDNVKCIISDCAFTSPYDVFAHILKRDYHIPEFPVMNINSAICRKKAGYGFNDYSTLTAMKSNKCPVLFIHGATDNFVPTKMVYENYEACTAPKEILVVENAGHGASAYEDTETYEKTELGFIEKYIPEN
ncbi:MAG: alpha/beta hydrolase [Ruminococcus flavefaciens]|nr:alpha/beta hydrolase [Ruminococcus flavefaciens]MCM1230976.1 alpha/beta hydrolase [Ruminococcus flavefaciens]